MNDELKEMPYRLPEGSFEALQARIRSHTTARPAATPVPARRTYRLAAASLAAAAVLAGAVLTTGYFDRKAPQADLQQMLATASVQTLEEAAAKNYDDIFNDQKL